MIRCLSAILVSVLALLLLWGSVSWYCGNVAKRNLQAYVLSQSADLPQRFFSLELLDYQENFTGAEAHLVLKFTVPALAEQLGDVRLVARSVNGPVFMGREGLEFGVVRWKLRLDQVADQVLANSVQNVFVGQMAQAILRVDFFDQLHFRLAAEQLRSTNWSADQLHILGQLDLNSGAYDVAIGADHSELRLAGWKLMLPHPALSLQRLAQRVGLAPESNAPTLDFNSSHASLFSTQKSETIPFNLSSRGSIWLNNDTLSGDWQVLLENPPSQDVNYASFRLKFRELLAEGAYAYWKKRAYIEGLLEQAQWAQEEVETPEQQDFLISLYREAEQLQKAWNHDLIGPMLRYQDSQLSLDAVIKQADGVESQLNIAGQAEGESSQPQLKVTGKALIQASMLSPLVQQQLEKWQQRLWVSADETTFAADISMHEQQLLLNHKQVSWAQLIEELKQVLDDQ